MDDNNLQDFFNLGSDDKSPKAAPSNNVNPNPNSNTTPNANPNVAPLDDFFNNVEPLATKQNEINNNTVPNEPVSNPSVQNTVNNVNQGVNQVNQTANAINNEVPQNNEPIHSTIDTNPMQTTLSENSVNPGQYNPEPDPMLEHMADNNIPGADLNNAFSTNPGGPISSPNPSDVYKNSAAMNYANNAQAQVNFNQQQQQQFNNGGYSTKKKTNPLLVALLIFLIIAVFGVLGYFVYTTALTKKADDNSNKNQNTVTPVVDDLPKTYQYLSDIDSLSSVTKGKLEGQSEYALINSSHGVLTQSNLPMSLHFVVDGEYFVLDVNKNKDMYFEDIRIPKIELNQSDEVVFYYINPSLEFIKGVITITDLTGYDLIKTNENYETVTINLWDLFYSDNELDGFYKLNDRYFLKLRLEDSNISSLDEDELNDLLDGIIEDFAVSTDSDPTDNSPYTYLNGYVEIDEKEYKNLKLDDKFSLDLVDSLYVVGWTINKTDNANVLTALTKDGSYNIQIVELEDAIQDINNLATELSKDYKATQTLLAKYTDDTGFELDVPVIADANGNLLGIAVESEDTCYLFLIAGSSIDNGSYATTYIPQEVFLDQMTYLFKNVIKYNTTADDSSNPSRTDNEDDEDDEDEEEDTNSVDTNTNTNTNSNSNSNTNTNTSSNTTDEDEDEDVNETENTSTNTNSNTNTNRTSRR